MNELIAYLCERGVFSPAQGRAAGEMSGDVYVTLTQALRAIPGIDERRLLRETAAFMRMPYADRLTAVPAMRDRLPLTVARHHGLAPVSVDADTLVVALSDPLDRAALEDAATASKMRVTAVVAPPAAVDAAIRTVYGLGAAAIEGEQRVSLRSETARVEDLSAGDESGVVRLVNQIIQEAIDAQATDIHLEPYRNTVRVRMRADGELRDMRVADAVRAVYDELVARLKVMAQLDTVERRRPQDGRVAVKTADRTVDLRLSVIPSAYGESVVVRVLAGETAADFESLGFYPEHAAVFRSWMAYPHGIVFVTGPTGSGKTTTLYAFLRGLDRDRAKIVTMEDPIEYELDGVTQIPVNPQIGFTFAAALRSVLRHDPDVIMVGEVRDGETAELAIRSALTGHLLFSTIHTNDAAAAPLRLIDLGAEPFLVASASRAFVAQRLVRVLCPHCKKPHQAPQGLPPLFADISAFAPAGCPLCEMSGYKGRTVVYEFVPVSETLAEAIRPGMTAEAFRAIAISAGGSVFFDEIARRKVADGITSPEEVMRVMR
jgi:type II secretory ATPase GspE/PulE/Tfp pilus assembly ATPase PilB-like protein